MPSEDAFSGKPVSFGLAGRSRPRESVSACRRAIPMSAAACRADASIPAIPAFFLQTHGGDERWLLEEDNRRDDGGGGQSVEWSFDRVNHDRLMARIAQRISDKRLLKLIRAFLEAGVMENGLVSPVDEGTPQGGPVTPWTQKVTSSSTGKLD